MNRCSRSPEFIAREREALVAVLGMARRRLGSRKGRPVSHREAEDYFIRHCADRYTRVFRAWYCRQHCPAREACQAAKQQDARAG